MAQNDEGILDYDELLQDAPKFNVPVLKCPISPLRLKKDGVFNYQAYPLLQSRLSQAKEGPDHTQNKHKTINDEDKSQLEKAHKNKSLKMIKPSILLRKLKKREKGLKNNPVVEVKPRLTGEHIKILEDPSLNHRPSSFYLQTAPAPDEQKILRKRIKKTRSGRKYGLTGKRTKGSIQNQTKTVKKSEVESVNNPLLATSSFIQSGDHLSPLNTSKEDSRETPKENGNKDQPPLEVTGLGTRLKIKSKNAEEVVAEELQTRGPEPSTNSPSENIMTPERALPPGGNNQCVTRGSQALRISRENKLVEGLYIGAHHGSGDFARSHLTNREVSSSRGDEGAGPDGLRTLQISHVQNPEGSLTSGRIIISLNEQAMKHNIYTPILKADREPLTLRLRRSEDYKPGQKITIQGIVDSEEDELTKKAKKESSNGRAEPRLPLELSEESRIGGCGHSSVQPLTSKEQDENAPPIHSVNKLFAINPTGF